MRFTSTARGFVRLGHRDQVRLAAAWSLLGLSRLLILLLPFTVVRRLLGEDRSAASSGPAVRLDPDQAARAAKIGWAVETAARLAPWRSDCYPQALTARTFLALRRIPHEVSFGVRRDGDRLVAHAWVHAGDLVVTGGNEKTYTEVGRFTWSPARKGGNLSR